MWQRQPVRKQEDSLMTRNEGTIDRALRIFLGIVLIGLALNGTTAFGWIGVVPLLTGLVGTCPLYSILGINTCKVK
jgi:fatty acid desaturase